ncbi:MAG: secretion protein HlyD [Lautropia sp. SCN 66-9]|nr:MAG: secretion protein HlyD [Lautropia sp. SCN 66-9]
MKRARRAVSSRLSRVIAGGLMAALVAAGCGQRAAPAYQGYIEGEYLYLAAPQPGYLQSLDAVRGSRITAGQLVFTIAADPDLQALAQADAQAQSARQRVDNLKEPRRAPEIAALEANLRSAESSLALAGTRLRQQQAQAQLDAVREQLATYRSSLGRQAEVRGAEADLRAADALVAQKRWAVERKNVAAPAAGEITETYYRPGEWVPAGTPVAALLPDTRRRLRFFVPETELARLAPGKLVEASCDGCAAPIRATIDFVAVEAAPALEQAAGLRPGLPIDVRLVEAR